MSEFTTVARPYAKAAFEFAVQHNEIEKWQQMLNFCAQVIQDSHMQQFLSVANGTSQVIETIFSICDDKLDQKAQNFIKIIAENKRILAIPAIYEQFKSYVDEYHSIAEVEVISASVLSTSQQQKIASAVENKINRKVKLICSVDKTLIAGAIIRTTDFVIDGSSRGQLDRLANELRL